MVKESEIKNQVLHTSRLHQILACGWQTTPSMPAIISPKRLKRELPNFVCKWSISSASLWMTDYTLIGMVRVICPIILNFVPNHIFGISKARHFKFCADWRTGVFMHA